MKHLTAEQRTISLFTGKTDAEAGAAARDGSEPDPEYERRYLAARPKAKWKPFDGLRQYEAKLINALIVVEKIDGVWKYRAYRGGRQLGLFDSIAIAADAAEARMKRLLSTSSNSEGLK